MENLNKMIIFILPTLLIVKGFYYWVISNALSDKKRDKFLRKYSKVKLTQPFDFYEKNRYISKIYLVIGSIITGFCAIFNMCYQDFTTNKILSMILILFIIDIALEQLALIKCKLKDYDIKKKSESDEC